MTGRIGIVVASFNREINEKMLENAKDEVKKQGGEVSHVVWVNGAYDMPLVVKKLLDRSDVDAAVLLGSVIQGKTYHDIIVAEVAAWKAAELSVQFDKPVLLGISGPRQTRQDAMDRVGKMDRHAVQAAFEMLKTLKQLED